MALAQQGITTQTISLEGIKAVLAGTPLANYADYISQLANQYGLDANWALAYIKWESGYLTSQIASYCNNPFDILCNRDLWGVNGCYEPGNGYSYSTFGSIQTGLEAGFRLFSTFYVQEGYDTWEKSLARALCGNLGCVADQWVLNVIADGEANMAAYPYSAPVPTPPPLPPPPPIIPPEQSSTALLAVGGLALVIAAGLIYALEEKLI